jgi:hypothetical protein
MTDNTQSSRPKQPVTWQQIVVNRDESQRLQFSTVGLDWRGDNPVTWSMWVMTDKTQSPSRPKQPVHLTTANCVTIWSHRFANFQFSATVGLDWRGEIVVTWSIWLMTDRNTAGYLTIAKHFQATVLTNTPVLDRRIGTTEEKSKRRGRL